MIAQGRILAGPVRIPTEITQIEAWALREACRGRQHVLEIGSAWGFSTVLLAQEAELVMAVDPHDVWDTWIPFINNLMDYGVLERVTAVKGRSQDELPKMLSWGGAGFFDLAFVDGDHGEAVADFDLRWCKALVRRGGIIAVHDYSTRWPGVLAAVDRQLPGMPAWRIQRLYLAVNE